MMNYEKLLEFAFSVYKAPRQSVDAVQTLFLKVLAPVTLLVFVGHVLGTIAPEGFGLIPYYVTSNMAYLLTFVVSVPYISAIIHQALKPGANEDNGFVSLLLSSTSWTISKMILVMAGIALLTLLPYLVGQALQVTGYDSNILASIVYILFASGLMVIFFTISRLMGAIVYSASGKSISLQDMFRVSNGHFLSFAIIIAVTIIPIELLTQILLYGLDGLVKYTPSLIIEYTTLILQAFVRACAFLIQMYLMWTAITLHMKNNKLL